MLRSVIFMTFSRLHILGLGVGALLGLLATVVVQHALAIFYMGEFLGSKPPPVPKAPEVIAVFVQPEPTPAPPAPAPPEPVPPQPLAPQPPTPPPPKPRPPKPRPQPKKPTPAPVAVADPTPAPNAPVGVLASELAAEDEADDVPSPATASPSGPPGPPAVVQPSSHASYLGNPKPNYPDVSRRFGEEGTVRLRVLVGADGRAHEVNVERSSGYRRLDKAALDAVRRWRFVPGTRGGVPEAMWYIVPIEFVLKDVT